MKIISASGKIVDTDKLGDKDAALHEAINNLYEVSEKFGVTSFAQVLLKEQEGLGLLYLPDGTDETRAEEYSKLVSCISTWLKRTSGGVFYIARNDIEGEDNEGEDNQDEGKGLE